jgi:hypothetical protein
MVLCQELLTKNQTMRKKKEIFFFLLEKKKITWFEKIGQFAPAKNWAMEHSVQLSSFARINLALVIVNMQPKSKIWVGVFPMM